MNQFLNQYDFTLALNSNNAEFIWLYLKTAINSALNLYVPKISVKKSNQPIWFNTNVRHKIKCLCTAKKQHARHPTECKQLKVIDLPRELQRMISDAKHDYESNFTLNYARNNNNKIFKYMSSVKGRENFPAEMFYIMTRHPLTRVRLNYLIIIFTQFFLQLQALHLLYQSHK